jgi:putative SOS response-associated peptidase YedK
MDGVQGRPRYNFQTGARPHVVCGFLATAPNAAVQPIHPKEVPVILTKNEEHDAWMRAPWVAAKVLKRPEPDVDLKIARRGVEAQAAAA